MSVQVQIVEVGLRDGLQNEKTVVSVPTRIEMARRLSNAGFKRIEVGAFVRSDKVPQMAGSHEVIGEVLKFQKTGRIPGDVEFSALVPNEKGMSEALETGIAEVAIFASSTESFSKANINCTIEESFDRFRPVVQLAQAHNVKVRGYLSVCFGCPYEGAVSEDKVVEVAKRLHQMGCYEISIGDTIGVADPAHVERLMKKIFREIPSSQVAGHFHDTRGTAVANILMAYQAGVRVFDASLGGLGGCPYAPGASGNVATEDVVYMFERMGIQTGINLSDCISINHWLSSEMHKELSSKVSKAT